MVFFRYVWRSLTASNTTDICWFAWVLVGAWLLLSGEFNLMAFVINRQKYGMVIELNYEKSASFTAFPCLFLAESYPCLLILLISSLGLYQKEHENAVIASYSVYGRC